MKLKNNMKDLLESRGRLEAAMRDITEHPAGTDGDLSAEQEEKFDNFKLGLESLKKQIERRAYLDDLDRRAEGTPIAGTGDDRFDDLVRKVDFLDSVRVQVPEFRDKSDCGLILEVSAELQRRSGRKAQGIMVPMQVFQRRWNQTDTGIYYPSMERRVITTTLPAGGPGSNLIGTDHRGDLYIDLLRAGLVTNRLGARILTGLVGDMDIPKGKTGSVAAFIAENAALTPGDMEFTKVSFTPKHAGVLSEISRNALLQTSPDVEQLYRFDFAAALAQKVDEVAILGGGANEPDGILETANIGDIPLGTNGGHVTYDNIADLIGLVDDSNVTNPAAFLSNTKVKTYCSKLKDGEGIPLGLDKIFQNYPRIFSNVVPHNLEKGGSGEVCSPLIFGDFSDLIIGYWSELDILVNPYESTAYSKGNVQVRGMLTMDLAVRHAESFAAIKDILTT